MKDRADFLRREKKFFQILPNKNKFGMLAAGAAGPQLFRAIRGTF